MVRSLKIRVIYFVILFCEDACGLMPAATPSRGAGLFWCTHFVNKFIITVVTFFSCQYGECRY